MMKTATMLCFTVTLPLCLLGVEAASGEEGWFGHADYLYLSSSGPDAAYAVGQSAGMPNGSIYNAGSHSNSAVSVTFGYRPLADVEVAFRYTNFEANSFDQQSALPGGALATTRLHPDNSSIAATYANADAGMQLHVFDLEAGSWFHASKDLGIRPFFGVRTAMIDHSLISRYNVGASSRFAYDSVDLDAFGLRTGADARWNLVDGLLYVEGGGAASLLLARSRTGHLEGGALAATYVRDDYNHALPVADAYLGLVLERGPFFVASGYTTSAWFNTGSYVNFTDDIADGQNVRERTDLLLSGGYFRVGWNW
ncbi:MAG: Lpg1974 family pore-forming outer membrane protein [Pirellulaceae bacterium]